MAKAFQLPNLHGDEIWVNPSRIQAIRFHPHGVEIVMNIPGLIYSYTQDESADVRKRLVAAGVIEGLS